MAEVVCPNCGHRNQVGANFCSSCGRSLEPPVDDHPTQSIQIEAGPGEPDLVVEPDEIPDGGALLVVRRGPNVGSRFALEADTVTAGRHPDSDIFLDDITVSRRHAEIRRSGETFLVRDVGSLNGTYVNRDRIDEADLRHGDEVQIGKFKLIFVTGPHTEE